MPTLTQRQAQLLAEIIKSGGRISFREGAEVAMMKGVTLRNVPLEDAHAIALFLNFSHYTEDGFVVYSAAHPNHQKKDE